MRIGVDLGGTNIAAGLLNENYEIIIKKSVKTDLPRPAIEIADSIVLLVKEIMEEENLKANNIVQIGIGTPGAVLKDGTVSFSSNLGFKDTPLRELIEKDLPGIPVKVGNDANCAALGEAIAGAGKGCKDFLAVTLGTGIGGGILIDGHMLTGINGAAGEIGHMTIRTGGIKCPCGREGCFEQYASATALIRQTKEALKGDVDKKSLMWDYLEKGIESVNGITAFKAARLGDTLGKQVVNKYIDFLAEGTANLINIFQPEMVCLGGGISKEGEFLLKPLREKILKLEYTGGRKPATKIKTAFLGNDAGIIGAAFLE